MPDSNLPDTGPRSSDHESYDLIVGGNNQITRFLIPLLMRKSQRKVVVLSRAEAPSWCPEDARLRWCSGGLADFEADSPEHPGAAVNWLIYVAPLSLFSQLSPQLAPSRLVVMSSTSIITKRDSDSERERDVASALQSGERTSVSWSQQRDIPWTVFRPTLIYGCGMDSNLTTIVDWIRRLRVIPVPGRGAGLRQPLHAEDVATAVLDSLGSESTVGQIYELSGGTTLSYRAMLAGLFDAVGLRRRILPLPARLVRLLLMFARLWPSLRHLDPAMVDRFEQDLVFDHSAATRDFGFDPRPFVPDAANFPLR